MEKGTVKRRILISNVVMVLATLVIFLAINMFIIFCYSESIEDEVKTTIESVVDPDEIDTLLKHYTIYRNEFILLFGIDGILCIAGLIVVSQVFTKNLTEHIMKPLDELDDAAKRIKDNNLKQEITYTGDKEFENVCDSFNDMMKSISSEQEKNRKYEKARTDMIAGISHDLRTPLTAIKGTIKGLLDGVASKPEQQKMFLETAYRRTGDMDMLLNQLFLLSKIETGHMPVFMQSIEVSEFLMNYVNSQKDVSDNQNETINIDTHGLAGYIMADTEQLLRILDNILENSRKYAAVNPLVIGIDLSVSDNKCIICVKDNGAGVPDDKLQHIFEEFYRADESRNVKEGNGLGLYIVKYLMNAMEGDVRAANEGGLAIYLEFPLAEQKGEQNV